MQRYLCYIQYRGGSLSGWQFQAPSAKGTNRNTGKGFRTVESVIRDTLDEFVGRGFYQSLTGASRTDAGVHALQNAFHIDVLRTKRRSGEMMSPYNGAEFRQGFNAIAKQQANDDVALLQAIPAPYGMSARFDAVRKVYLYRIICPVRSVQHFDKGTRPIFDEERAWMIPETLDIENMRQVAKSLQGYHDFETFQASGCSASSAHRLLETVEVRESGEDCDFLEPDSSDMLTSAQMNHLGYKYVDIVVKGPSFLYNMVRNVAGFLVAVGTHQLSTRAAAEAILTRDRSSFAYQTAPSQGLHLVHVQYPNLVRLFNQISRDSLTFCRNKQTCESGAVCPRQEYMAEALMERNANNEDEDEDAPSEEKNVHQLGNPWYQPHLQNRCCRMLHKARRTRELYRRGILEADFNSYNAVTSPPENGDFTHMNEEVIHKSLLPVTDLFEDHDLPSPLLNMYKPDHV